MKINKTTLKNKGAVIGVIAVIVAFFILCMVNLGSFKTISSPYSFSKWESNGYETIIFESEGAKDLSEVWIYLYSPSFNDINKAETESVQDIKIHFHYASAVNTTFYSRANNEYVTIQNKLSSFGKWYKIGGADFNISSTYKYYEIATDSNIKIGEVVFIDANKNVMPIKVAKVGLEPEFKTTNYSHSYAYGSSEKLELTKTLIDEQKKFDYKKVQNNGTEYIDNVKPFYESELSIVDTITNFVNGEGNYIDSSINPLGYELIAIGSSIFGLNTFGMRIIPALFFIASLVAVYFIAKLLFENGWLAVLATTVFGIAGYGISLATVVNVQTIFVAFTLFSLYYTLRFYIRGISDANYFKGLLNIILGGLFYALSFAVTTQAVIMFLPIIAIMVAGIIRQYKAYKNRKTKLTNENANEQVISLNASNYKRKAILTIISTISFYVIVPVFVLIITALISYGLLGRTYVDLGGNVFKALINHISSYFGGGIATSYTTTNAVSPLLYVLGYSAETLAEGKYVFGNSVVTMVFIASLIFVIIKTITSVSKNGKFRPFANLIIIVLFYIACYVGNLFAVGSVSNYLLCSAISSIIIIYAYQMLNNQDKKVILTINKKGLTLTNLSGIVLLVIGIVNFALCLSGLLCLGASVNLYSFNTIGQRVGK